MEKPQKNPEIQPPHNPEIKPGTPDRQNPEPHPEIKPGKDPLPGKGPQEIPPKKD